MRLVLPPRRRARAPTQAARSSHWTFLRLSREGYRSRTRRRSRWGDAANLRVDKDGAVVTTEIGGVPVDVRLGQDGVSVGPRQISPKQHARDRERSAVARQRAQEKFYANLRAAHDRAHTAGR
jgi:hypothetical protein